MERNTHQRLTLSPGAADRCSCRNGEVAVTLEHADAGGGEWTGTGGWQSDIISVPHKSAGGSTQSKLSPRTRACHAGGQALNRGGIRSLRPSFHQLPQFHHQRSLKSEAARHIRVQAVRYCYEPQTGIPVSCHHPSQARATGEDPTIAKRKPRTRADRTVPRVAAATSTRPLFTFRPPETHCQQTTTT